MKYEVGDQVKIINTTFGNRGTVGTITNILGSAMPYLVTFSTAYGEDNQWSDESDLELVTKKVKPLSIHTKEGGFPAFKTDPPDNGLPHTPHYMNGLIETIDVIKMALTEDEFRGFLKGNVLKYQIRAPHKHETPDEDYQKAKDYYDLLEDQE